jgi:threonylcarbamoyladenosine tRNA methylthiotransferase MtaB
MEGVVPANVRAKPVKMLRGLSVKNADAFSIGDKQVFYSKVKIKGYIHGFENYVSKTPWNPELVNTLHDINLTKIDEDGSVRMDFFQLFG